MLISTYFTFNILINKIDQKIDMIKLVKYLVQEGFNNQIINYSYNDPLNTSEPLLLIERNLNFKLSNKKDINIEETMKEIKEDINEPIIYLYNSHDEEKYTQLLNGAYNIMPNVRIASLILDERLNDLGLNTISEDRSINELLIKYNWTYKDSYKASRIYLEDTYNNNKSLKYFIDIHRDSMNKDITTIKYDDISYAKLLFVIGKDNKTYQKNLELSTKLSELTNELIPDISRGISIKEGDNVNGIYNQDFNDNVLLIEIGGQDNNIEEISNTINILAESIYKYIKGDINGKEKI